MFISSAASNMISRPSSVSQETALPLLSQIDQSRALSSSDMTVPRPARTFMPAMRRRVATSLLGRPKKWDSSAMEPPKAVARSSLLPGLLCPRLIQQPAEVFMVYLERQHRNLTVTDIVNILDRHILECGDFLPSQPHFVTATNETILSSITRSSRKPLAARDKLVFIVQPFSC